MDKSVNSEIGVIALRIVEGSGPIGFYVGAAIVFLTLAVILLARFAGIFDDVRSGKQKTDFLDRVLSQYDRLAKVEASLRIDVERVEVENEALKDRLLELQAATELLRNQIRRLIDMLNAVKQGRMDPSELPADVAEAVL